MEEVLLARITHVRCYNENRVEFINATHWMKVVIKANIFPGTVPLENDKNMLLIVNTIFVSHRNIRITLARGFSKP